MRRGALLRQLWITVALTASAACGSGGSSGDGNGGSWADAYPTISEMTAHADAVAVGQVASIQASYTTNGIPYTDFVYQVSTWVPALSPEPGATSILVHQPGGGTDEGGADNGGDPLMQVGEQSMLFLRGYAPGKYFIMGGPTGRLLIVDGQVTALPEGRASDGLPASVDSVITQVQQHARP